MIQTTTTNNNFYISSYIKDKDGNVTSLTYRKIVSYETIKLSGLELFVHKIREVDRPFRVTDPITGCCLSKGSSKWEAEKNFNKLLKEKGEKEILLRIFKIKKLFKDVDDKTYVQ